MRYGISWVGDPEDVRLTSHGVARAADLIAMIREAVADRRWRQGMKVLVDHTGVDFSPMVGSEMEEWVGYLTQSDALIGYQQVAVVNAADYRGSRMVGYLLDRKVAWVGQVFSSLAEAREWLRRPPDYQHAHVAPGHA